MDIAALITWLIAAVGGFVMLGTWFAKGGNRRDAGGGSRFPPALILSHFLLAAIGLVLWIIYLASDSEGLTWVSFAILVVVALLGFTMFARWLPQVRGSARSSASPAGASTAEAHFPVAVVLGHGLFAAATLVLVFIAALTA